MRMNFDFESEIVISGMAGRFPNSANLDDFWQNLIEGRDMVSDNFDRFNADEYDIPSRLAVLKDLDKFDAEFFSVHGKQASAVDTRLRFLLETTYEAILDAGINPTTIQGSRTGVFVAATEGESGSIWKRYSTKPNVYGVLGNVLSMMANRLSFTFDFHGPSYVIDSACSGSSVAIQQALHAIRTGLCDAAVVAGACTQHDPISSFCFHNLKMTSPEGKCKSFDASANGYVRAEAVVVIYICKRQVAKRSYATLVHAATNSDGYKEQGITFPSALQQENVIRQVYVESGVDPLDVDYIEAHGTGTRVGDPQEISAIAKVFCNGRRAPLLVGAVKSNMGHSEPVAGLCSLAKMILSHAHGVIPANLHYNTPNPDIPALHDGRVKVVDRNHPFTATYVAFNSMGFGGTNAHVLLKLDPRGEPKTWTPQIPVMLACSGRTVEAVETLLKMAATHLQNQNLVGLLQGIYKSRISNNNFAGYVIADQDKLEIQIDKRDSGREMWFIYTGLGSQWAGMSRDLIKFDAFKKSIGESAQTLLNNHNFDIISLLESGDSKNFEDFKNSVVSITAIQIALTDLLKTIGIAPEGIIGHSTGEVAAGYADSCLTQHQAVLTSFARVQAVLESNLKAGMVASVGLTWEDAKIRCPPGAYPAIHNAKENVTVAGPPDVIKAFVAQLESEGIFAKLVRSASFGFHSPLVEESGKLAKVLLEAIIPDPKPRSNKWLSSSVPEHRWDTDLAKYCSADYYVNNGVNPVHFYPTLKYVPENSVVLEIAPHCFMQSLLKQSLPINALTTGLIHVKSQDNCKYFLDAVGKCYMAGINVDIAALYEPVEFPAPASTPNISSMIRWDHSATYVIPHHSSELSRQKGIKFTYNLASEQDAFLEGHSVDNKILYPATGYMWLVWKFFAENQGSRFDKHPVVFENVRFERVTFLNKLTETDFLINIFPATGKFEISESDMLVCSGTVRNVEESASKEMLTCEDVQQIDMSGPYMNKEDFYKEMHLRGYGHSGLFQGIYQADLKGKWAKIKWQGDWISFMDAILQTVLLRNASRDLYVPTRLQKFTIDPLVVRNFLEENDNIITVKSWDVHRSGMCPGIEVRGAYFSKYGQKSRQLAPCIVEQAFIPYSEQGSSMLSENGALEASLEIAVENSCGEKFIFTEILGNPKNMFGDVVLNHCVLKFSTFEFRLVNKSERSVHEHNVSVGPSKMMSLQDLQSREKSNLVFADEECGIVDAANAIVSNGFVLLKGSSTEIELHPELSLVSEKRFLNEAGAVVPYFLLRKLAKIPTRIKFVATDGDLSWVGKAKRELLKLPELERIYFTSESPTSGLAGFIKCLIREYTSEKIRCFHAIDPMKININHPSDSLRLQIEKDLVFNVYKYNTWGAFHNLPIPREEFRKQKLTPFTYANARTLGDLSSLSWVESPLRQGVEDLAHVHYAALNFRDVMLASGKLSQDAVTEKASRSECVLGLEFSGQYQGKRVCGMGPSECLATYIDPKPLVLLDIPENWTYEEAATVPWVYVTVYLALKIRGKMQPGESILIHAGSGGVGQAAIHFALSMGCRVFTTVSTTEKREFLKARFPALTDDCFANSRDATEFESHINKQTKGRGVDLVLNSLAQDKLFASIRCLAINGRFLEIGKFDIFNDTNIGLSILSRGVSVVGILADQLFEYGTAKDLAEIREYLTSGMKSGAIRPLSYHVFKHTQLEEAFRFMAQGKHFGKVLVQVKEDEATPVLIPAHPRTYFQPTKSYVIIGGLGGMGFELVNWMVLRGARRFVLSSRSATMTSYHEYHVGIWKQTGVTVVVERLDASTLEGARRLLENARKERPIGGIFNVGVVLRDALFENQTQADFEEVMKCKAKVTAHLDQISRELAPEIQYFVVFSSITAARGNPGQTNYGFANSVMERICEQRKADGLPAMAIQWGAVGEVGVFHRTMKNKKVFGIAPQSLKSCLETLDVFLQSDKTIVSSFIPYQRKDVAQVDADDSLIKIAAKILGIKDMKRINPKTPLVDMGMDSLMAAELAQVLQSRANVQLSQKAHSQLNFEKLAEIDAKRELNPVDQKREARNNHNKVLALKNFLDKAVFKMKSLQTSPETVFIVHPLDGTVLMLEDLVRSMEATVYGIEYVREAPLDSVEKLAEFYLNEIKKIQPKGPYKIAGYSFGGMIAFEIVLQLEKQNADVSLLLLLDGSPQWKNYVENAFERNNDEEEVRNMLFVGYLQQYKSDASQANYKELVELETTEERLNYLTKILHEAHPEISVDEIKASTSCFVARAECGRKYEPSGRVKAKTVLLKALQGDLLKSMGQDYGLSNFCENLAEVIDIDGNHTCFYEKPNELGIPGIINKILA